MTTSDSYSAYEMPDGEFVGQIHIRYESNGTFAYIWLGTWVQIARYV